jgi:hypothetical protein
VYRRERIISLEGALMARTRALAVQAQEQLAATLADGSMGDFAVDDPDLGVRQARVRLSATPMADGTTQGIGRIAWQLQFTAPDHRKYGDPVTVSTGLPGGGTGLSWPIGSFFNFGTPGSLGQVTISNDGTAPTEPDITVTGPLAQGFQVTQTETGRRLVYPSPVSTDVVIDCGEGTATSGGQDRTGLLTVDEFFTIGPRSSSTFQFSTLGAEPYTSPASAMFAAAPAYH